MNLLQLTQGRAEQETRNNNININSTSTRTASAKKGSHSILGMSSPQHTT
jgi:hypothetical protein